MEVNWGLGSPLKEHHMHIDVLPGQLGMDDYLSERAKKDAGIGRAACKNKTILLIFRSIAQRISFDVERGVPIAITIEDVRREADRIGIQAAWLHQLTRAVMPAW